MTSERFFFHLHRVNAVAFALLLLGFGILLAFLAYAQWQPQGKIPDRSDNPGFGAAGPERLPFTGQEVATPNGSIAAYYQTDDSVQRLGGAGLTLVSMATGKNLLVASRPEDAVIDFEYIYDQSRQNRKVIGYYATVSTDSQYEAGRMDLVVGALPALTRNVIARNLRYVDLPTLTGNGSLAVLLWPEEGKAEFVAIRMHDGAVVDRASVTLPELREQSLSSGSGVTSPEMRGSTRSDAAPQNSFGY